MFDPEGKGHHGHDGLSAFWRSAVAPVAAFEFTITDSFANPGSNTCARRAVVDGMVRLAIPSERQYPKMSILGGVMTRARAWRPVAHLGVALALVVAGVTVASPASATSSAPIINSLQCFQSSGWYGCLLSYSSSGTTQIRWDGQYGPLPAFDDQTSMSNMCVFGTESWAGVAVTNAYGTAYASWSSPCW